jgi:hypothetical protein
MYKVCFWIVMYFGLLMAKNLISNPHGVSVATHDFKLLDGVCVEVEGEAPILLSEIERKMKANDISFSEAQEKLIQDRRLRQYAKKRLDINAITKAADDYIAKIMEKNNLNEKKLEALLGQPPYSTTLNQFKKDTENEILQNSIKQQMGAQISITDDQAKVELQRRQNQLAQGYDVVFITVSSKTAHKAGVRQVPSTAEFKRAKEIGGNLTSEKSINDIKKLYGSEKGILIIGPIAYEKGSLKKSYEDQLKSHENKGVIGPFEDDGSATMIWKVKRTGQKMGVTALEKVKKELYEKAVVEKLKAVSDALDNSTVIVKNCGKR